MKEHTKQKGKTLSRQGITHLPLREVKLNVGMEPIFSDDEIYNRVSDAVRAFTEQPQGKSQ